MKIVDPSVHVSLDHYASHSHLTAAVAELQQEAERVLPRLRERTIWMVNSTAEGGGVAELLPAHISLLRQLGLDVRWAVLESRQPHFFPFTKRLHNLIHAADEPAPSSDDRAVYESVNEEEAAALMADVRTGDILVVHDPQPMALGTAIARHRAVHTVWRCHIGVDEDTSATRAAWDFLRPYADAYHETVFSLADYVPDFLREHSHIIHPSIDPLSHKNRDLSLHKLVGVLSDADLVQPHWPLIAPPFQQRARRLQPDGTWAPATTPDDIGLLARPIVTQVSRWDRLKGFVPLLDAFVRMKEERHALEVRDERHARRLEAARLILAGADPEAIADDPEAHAVMAELKARFQALPPEVQRDVAIVALPMHSRKENALMVNALQRASDIVAQNSLREGFGLTITEAMWKRIAVLGSAQACGVRLQVRDSIDGRLAPDPEDARALAHILADMLADPERLEEWGRSAQQRVYQEFLIFGELRQWLALFHALVGNGKQD